MCEKLRLEGAFDFMALARATPGYVGADLAALTGAAGIVAVKRIFQDLSTLPVSVLPASGDLDMVVDGDGDAISQGPVVNGSALPTGSLGAFLAAHPGPLSADELAPLHVTFADFLSALPHVQPSATREGFATVPDVSWADVGALGAVRDELHMALVQPILRPGLFARAGVRAPAGVLLWGPPGCGKTLLAKAVANESKANFISVKGPELLNKAGRDLVSVHAELTQLRSTSARASVRSGKCSPAPAPRRPA
jgi:ribosome biogenesis ATPase